MPVEQNATLVRIVEPCQQLDEGGLAGAVFPHERQDLARVQLECQSTHRPALGPGVAKPHVLEREAHLNRYGKWPRIRRRNDFRLDLEERKQVVEVERLARDLRESHEQVLQQVPQASEGACEEREIANGKVAVERAPYDVGVGDIVGNGADRGEQASPACAPQRDSAIGLEEARGQRAVALDQEGVQAEDLHFLGRLRARARLPHVIELAPLRRAGVVERIALRVEMRLADECGQESDGKERDEPRSVDEQPRGEACDSDDILRLAEELPDQARTSGRLPPCPFQPILQLAVLEVLEVERGGVFHEPKAGLVAEPLRQQRVQQRHGAAKDVGEDRESEFQDEQPCDAVEQSAREPLPQIFGGVRSLNQQHDFIDDQLADVERRDRQQGAHDPQ